MGKERRGEKGRLEKKRERQREEEGGRGRKAR